MKLRILLVAMAALLLAQPGFADLRKYDVTGDQSTKFPTDGTILRPGTNSGKSLIDDASLTGTPVLRSLTVRNAFIDLVGGTNSSGIPGTTVTLDSRTDAGPTFPIAGQSATSGTVGGGAVTWGALTGWSQTGRLVCTTFCPGGCPTGVSSCVPFVGFEGTGPPAPLKSSSFTLDPFTFAGSGASFTSPAVEFVNLTGGAVTAHLKANGSRVFGSVPAIPLAALGGLGAGLVYLGSRALRRKKD
jgi:hypothetical protein